MEHLKGLLSSLLGNRLDRVSIIHELQKLKVEFDDDAPFVILKYKLQLNVIEIIAKEIYQDNPSVYYLKLKKETLAYLEFHHKEESKTMFHCCLVGCFYKTGRHRRYISHGTRTLGSPTYAASLV